MNLDAAFLEREYNPRVQIANFADFFARWKDQAAAARSASLRYQELAYGSAPPEKLDFFPAAQSGAPLLIFIHGGYWRALDKADFSWIAPAYVAAGISVAVLNYGLAPATPILKIVAQIRAACGWLHGNAAALRFDPQRIFCSGHSAGGHLTGMLLATDWPAQLEGLPKRLLAGALSISGVFDLRPLLHAQFLRSDLALDEAGARELSPGFLAVCNDAPLLRALGAEESGEFHRQSELIGAHWPAICSSAVIAVPGANHLSVCDALATPGNVLFETWCKTIAGRV